MIERPVSGRLYDIQGFSKYAVTPEGKIYRKHKHCVREIRPIWKNGCVGSRYVYVHITDDNGKARCPKVANIVWETFRGRKQKGMSIYHRNGVMDDNDIGNLAIIENNKLGKMTGPNSRRKTVVRIRRDGEVLEWYRSAREAGRNCAMSYQTVMDRCNRKIKNEFALDGTTFRWLDEEKKVEKFITLLKDANVRPAGSPKSADEWEW